MRTLLIQPPVYYSRQVCLPRVTTLDRFHCISVLAIAHSFKAHHFCLSCPSSAHFSTDFESLNSPRLWMAEYLDISSIFPSQLDGGSFYTNCPSKHQWKTLMSAWTRLFPNWKSHAPATPTVAFCMSAAVYQANGTATVTDSLPFSDLRAITSAHYSQSSVFLINFWRLTTSRWWHTVTHSCNWPKPSDVRCTSYEAHEIRCCS